MSTSPTTRTLAASLRALMEGLIDYAGLFPPAAVDMKTAVTNYARYSKSQGWSFLGSFIVPASRLQEFEAEFDSAGEKHWYLSVIIGPKLEDDIASVRAFLDRTLAKDRVRIGYFETKATSPSEVAAIHARLKPFECYEYFEVPADSDSADTIAAIRDVGQRAKIRTGGIVESAFPAAQQIAMFLSNCAKANVAFKATAGLHHPVRCVKPLTYESNAATRKMHGFLNVFVAAILAREGVRSDAIEAVLLNEQPDNFTFTDEKCEVRALHSVEKDGAMHNTNFAIDISTERIRAAREQFAVSFGSCSFEEPIDDLKALHLL